MSCLFPVTYFPCGTTLVVRLQGCARFGEFLLFGIKYVPTFFFVMP